MALLGASAAVSLILAEAGVRIFEATAGCRPVEPVPRGMYRPDPRYHHVLSPGYRGRLDGGCWETAVSVSAAGARGPETRPEVPAARRLLMLGDSYVFGYGVEDDETLPAALERALSRRSGGAGASWEVVNAGVPGWTSAQAALYLEERGAGVGAANVVYVIYLGNDVEDRVNLEDEAGSGRGEGRADPPQPQSRRRLLPSSRLAGILRERLREAAYVSGARRRPLSGPWFESFRSPMTARTLRGLGLLEADLHRMARTAAAAGMRLRGVIVPSWVQATQPTPGSLCRAFDCDPAEIDLEAIGRDVRAALGRAGIPSLDLGEAMIRAYAEGRYRFVAGGHWDAAGCALAAERIAAWIIEGAAPAS